MVVVPIEINTSDIFSQFNVKKEEVDNMLDNIAKSLALVYFAKLEEQVIGKLKSTRNRYLNNILLIDSGKLEGTVLLDYSKDPLIKQLEEGQGPWDMKGVLLNGPKSKISKKGVRYNTIPFSWGIPNNAGENFSSSLPQKIYDVVRKMEQTRGVIGGTQSQPLSIGAVPQQFQGRATRPEIKAGDGSVLFKAYTHRGSIYQGIVRSQGTNSTQGIYTSFRRVSENSSAGAFINKGIKAGGFIQLALDNMDIAQETGALIDSELAKLGFS